MLSGQKIRGNNMNKQSAFIFSNEYLTYYFHDEHPFNQKRLSLTVDLLKSLHLLKEEDIVPPAWLLMKNYPWSMTPNI